MLRKRAGAAAGSGDDAAHKAATTLEGGAAGTSAKRACRSAADVADVPANGSLQKSLALGHMSSHFDQSAPDQVERGVHGRTPHISETALSWVSVLALKQGAFVLHFDARASVLSLPVDAVLAQGAGIALEMRLSDGRSVWTIKCGNDEMQKMLPAAGRVGEDDTDQAIFLCGVFDHIERALQASRIPSQGAAPEPTGERGHAVERDIYEVQVDPEQLVLKIRWPDAEVLLPLEKQTTGKEMQDMMRSLVPHLITTLQQRKAWRQHTLEEVRGKNGEICHKAEGLLARGSAIQVSSHLSRLLVWVWAWHQNAVETICTVPTDAIVMPGGGRLAWMLKGQKGRHSSQDLLAAVLSLTNACMLFLFRQCVKTDRASSPRRSKDEKAKSLPDGDHGQSSRG